ncbi:MAG: MBL fold metallo-hydrolase [Candidatus Thorarchaeota archaeon]|nr:MBL fold metallo-hydrolase [Candidatus Thorarchaeota archaeon]
MYSKKIHRILVPTPFAVGAVNTYLIEGSPLTLIDTGVKSSMAKSAMVDGLNSVGYGLEDIEQILLTHGHVDHIGLAGTIVEARSGDISVWIHEDDAIRITDYTGYIEERMHSYVEIAKECGTPSDSSIMGSQRVLADYFLRFGESVENVSLVQDGQKLPSGVGDLQCLWVPGHSLGSVCYIAPEESVMFSGDHILGDISSNPSLDFEGSLGISMLRYFDSLRRVEPFHKFKVLPGHRDPITNLSERVIDLFADYDEKLHRAENTLTEEPISIYALSRILYGDYPDDSLVLALAETKDIVLILQQNKKARVLEIENVLYAVRIDG